MESLCRFVAPPTACGYLPEEQWQLEYEVVLELQPHEYMQRMLEGWRRFGDTLFRPRCSRCAACRSIRVLVDRFRPDRSQRRAWKANRDELRVTIGPPSVTRAKLNLYDRYHAAQADLKGWPQHPAKDPASYRGSFVDNPFPVLEWCYFLGNRLVGVGYVDDLPGGLSAIYFIYDPDERHRSLGTFNALSILDYAKQRNIPHVYLGYFVAGCRSMEYKTRFVPNQLLGTDGVWRDYLT
jgi:leucyl-tRNA---protein transferase